MGSYSADHSRFSEMGMHEIEFLSTQQRRKLAKCAGVTDHPNRRIE
jgi:hypothetical protein